jgi:hypothetical protein
MYLGGWLEYASAQLPSTGNLHGYTHELMRRWIVVMVMRVAFFFWLFC